MTTFNYYFELHCSSERWLSDNLPAPHMPPRESFKTEIPYNDYDDYYDSLDKHTFINYNTQHYTYEPESYATYYNSDSDSDYAECELENY